MPDGKWNIRFGQIFRYCLDALEHSSPGVYNTRLQDCFYYHPHDLEFFSQPATAEPFRILDLNHNLDAYRRYFTSTKSPAPADLSEISPDALRSTFIIVPAQGHELIGHCRALDEASETLRALGFDIRYAAYPDSLSDPKIAAKRLAALIEEWQELQPHLILVGYSTGARVAVELLQDRSFKELRPKVRALVSLAGALTTSRMEDTQRTALTRSVLEIFRKFKNHSETPLEARLVKCIKTLMSGEEVPWSEGLMEILADLQRLGPQMIDIPEQFELLREPADWTFPDDLDVAIDYFSIAAIEPRATLRGSKDFPQNPDDLYLYLTSTDLCDKMGPYNDALLGILESRFPKSMPRVHHLATLKADHWGIALPHVLDVGYEDPFPRSALMETLVLLMCEYYGAR